MRNLLTSLIISIAVISVASPSLARDDREDNKWDRDKKEQSHHSKKDKHHGNPFDKIMGQLDDLNDKLDELLANDVDLRGVKQNWDKKLDSTNGDTNGCNSDRFTCLWGDTVVRDNETGLVWEQSPDPNPQFNWQGAISHCANREVGGRKGWSLPTREQLASLVDDDNSPALPTDHPFDLDAVANYWSATTDALNPSFTWFVDFTNGFVFPLNKDGIFKDRAWCVRGGQSYDGQDVLKVLEVLPD